MLILRLIRFEMTVEKCCCGIFGHVVFTNSLLLKKKKKFPTTGNICLIIDILIWNLNRQSKHVYRVEIENI